MGEHEHRAEGVETPDQLRLIMRASCDFAQGYLFHKPMSAQNATQALMDEMYQQSNQSPPLSPELGFAA